MRRRGVFGLAIAASLAPAVAGSGEPLTIGAKADLRHRLVAEVTAAHLRATGIGATVAPGYSAPILHAAHLDGAVDIAWESVGIALTLHHDVAVRRAARLRPDEAVARLREAATGTALAWPASARTRVGRKIMVRRSTADSMDGPTLKNVRTRLRASDARLGVTSGFAGRPDGLAAVMQRHGRPWPIRRLPRARLPGALERGRVMAATLPVHDARTAGSAFVALEDRRDTFPPHRLVAGVRRSLRRAYPSVAPTLKRVGRAIDAKALIRLTAAVRDGMAARVAARRFLADTGPTSARVTPSESD